MNATLALNSALSSHQNRRRHFTLIYGRRGQARQLGAATIIDQANNICDYGGLEIACNLIREFGGSPDDNPNTDNEHFEYALPYGSPNVNTWQVQADGSMKYINEFGNQPKVEAPVLKYAETATTYDDPTFAGMPILTAAPAATQPLHSPAAATQAPPPPGTFTYGQGTSYASQLGPAPAASTGSSQTISFFPGAPSTPPAGGSGQAGGSGTAAPGDGGTDGGTENESGASGGGVFDLSWLDGDNDFITALKSIPTWAWIAAGGLAVTAAASSRRR